MKKIIHSDDDNDDTSFKNAEGNSSDSASDVDFDDESDFSDEPKKKSPAKKKATPQKTDTVKKSESKAAVKKASTPKSASKDQKTSNKPTKRKVDEEASASTQVVKKTTISTSSCQVIGVDDITRGPDIATEAEAKRIILKYFQRQNRPYSAIQVFDNLHKRAPKSLVEKALNGLSTPSASGTTGGLLSKEYGKAKIYYLDQKTIATQLNESDLVDLEDDIERMNKELSSARDNERVLLQDIAVIEAEPTDDKLDSVLNEVERRINEKESKSTNIKNQNIDADRLASLIQQHNYFREVWRTRRENCMDFVDNFAENSNKKMKDILADLGIDTDQASGLELPKKLEMPRK